MKDGKYTIDSIENGVVKLLFQHDEAIEEFLNEDDFSHEISQGLIVQIKSINKKIISKPMNEETNERRSYARSLLEKLKNKN